MSDLLSVAQFREHVKTAIPDAAVERLLTGNQDAIEERYGDLTTPRVLVRLGDRNGRFLYLSPRAASVSLVRELYTDFLANQYVVLDGPSGTWPAVDYTRSDWMLHDDGAILERMLIGTHPADHWEQRVEITYLPIDNTTQRILCLLELCRLDIKYQPGLQLEVVGLARTMYNHTLDYDRLREAILAMLAPRTPIFA
jgi:hypothetical protein